MSPSVIEILGEATQTHQGTVYMYSCNMTKAGPSLIFRAAIANKDSTVTSPQKFKVLPLASHFDHRRIK